MLFFGLVSTTRISVGDERHSLLELGRGLRVDAARREADFEVAQLDAAGRVEADVVVGVHGQAVGAARRRTRMCRGVDQDALQPRRQVQLARLNISDSFVISAYIKIQS